MLHCHQCNNDFDNKQLVNGKFKYIYNRKYCLTCFPLNSPLPKPKKSKTKICKKCGGLFYSYDKINGQTISSHRVNCLLCSPFETTNSKLTRYKDIEINDRQQEILNGLLLSDGYLSKCTNTTNSSFELHIADKDEKFIFWLYSELQNICNKGIYRNTKKNTVKLRTKHLPLLSKLRKKWYPNGKKIIPQDLIITPLSLAIWFAGDGCIQHMQNYEHSLKAQFYTNSFTYDEVIRLSNILKNQFYVNNVIYKIKNKEQYTINITNTADSKTLCRVIDDMFPPMERKSNKWLNLI